MNNIENFEEKGYTIIREFIDTNTVSIISQYMENKIRRGEWKEDVDSSESSRFYYYGDPLIEVLLVKCKDVVEQAIGKELLPTYSYCRVYQQGEELKMHIDRPACEISVTVSVAFKGEGNIPTINTKYKEKETCHLLNAGDAMIYKGCEVYHWRDPLLSGQIIVQFMLHYVDKNGPYKAFEKDTRPAIGAGSKNRRNK